MRGNGGWRLMGMGFLCGVMKKVLKLIMVMAVQLCEHAENHRFVHFKWVKCVVRERCLNKAITTRMGKGG